MSKLYYKNTQYIPDSVSINDSATSASSVWSSQKTSNQIAAMTPVKGTDYFTENDQYTILNLILNLVGLVENQLW